MNQEMFSKKKERLIQLIIEYKKNNRLSLKEEDMLSSLAEIINQISLHNITDNIGRLSYFIRDSFDVKNFSVDEFLYFDGSLNLHNKK